MILSLTSVISILTFSIVTRMFSSSVQEFAAVASLANYTKAKYLAMSSLEVVHSFLRKGKLDRMYEYGFLPESMPIPFGEQVGNSPSIIRYTAYEQTGKINVNELVGVFTGQESGKTREMLNQLSETLGINNDIWDAVVDYIDADSTNMPAGAEQQDYENLDPPRKIKNARLHSLEELLFVPGFNRRLLYDDLRSDEKKQEFSDSFFTEEEKLVVDEENDFKLVNCITTVLPYMWPSVQEADKININSANINVIMSLTADMTRDIAKKIIVERLKKTGGRFKSITELSQIPVLKANSLEGFTIYNILAKRITDKDRIFKVVAEATVGSQTAVVMSIYDVIQRKVVQYYE